MTEEEEEEEWGLQLLERAGAICRKMGVQVDFSKKKGHKHKKISKTKFYM